MVGRLARPGPARDDPCGSQDLVDPTINGIFEQALQYLHRLGTAATIVVPNHEEHISGLPFGTHAFCPIITHRATAIIEGPMRVDEEHVGARGLVLQSDPIHPALSQLVLGNPHGRRLSDRCENLEVPGHRGRVRRGSLEKAEAAEPGAAQSRGNILTLLKANEVEGALTSDPVVQRTTSTSCR